MGHFDVAYTITVSDWYHQQAPFLVNQYQAVFKEKGRGGLASLEPLPDSVLINDSQHFKFPMVPGIKYLFRIINMRPMASHIIKFEGHTMTIVEMDGVATAFTPATVINIAVAQRYLIIAETIANTDRNYGIISTMDQMMFNTPVSKPDPIVCGPIEAINEFVVKPKDNQAILDPVAQKVNNFGPMAHPFHIHGQIAQVVTQGTPGTLGHQTPFNGVYEQTPMRRDVLMVNANSYTIIRFKTGNPGIWLLHCHIEWHIEAGLVMTFVEDPVQTQTLNLLGSQDNYDICAKINMPYQGNAAGNTRDWFSMAGLATKPDKNPWGGFASCGAANCAGEEEG
ncbi:multicopper oxidase-domain-containing protein [Halenospora varia]|nr:multicopper oxidase-domain-containing protein [Halenospora varia]